MKNMTKLIFLYLISLLVFSSCAITGPQIPGKYFLDNQLVRVKSIPDIKSGRKRSMFIYDRLAAEYKKREQEEQEQDSSQPSNIPNIPFIPWTHLTSNYDLIKVDDQSLFLKTDSNNYYLLVLQRPIPNLLSRNDIRVFLNSNFWNKNMDSVMYGAGEICPVSRIYSIEGEEEMAAIRDHLLGKPKKYFYKKKKKQI